MKKLLNNPVNPLPSRALGVVLLVCLLLWGIPAMAQDCSTHLPTAGLAATALQTNVASERSGGVNGQKIRIQAYYDPSIPTSLGITASDWEVLLTGNIMMFDSALQNMCVTEGYGSLDVRVSPSTTSIPANTDDAYNAATDQSNVLHQMWQSNYTCYVPHIVCFITPIGSSGVRGTSTVLTAPFAATNTGIVVVRADQVGIGAGNKTIPHEIGHAMGAFHVNDSYAPDLSYCAYGATPDGQRSIMMSPTTFNTVLNEGDMDMQCSSALHNGITNIGQHWLETFSAYTSTRPGFSINISSNTAAVFADSQSVSITTVTNRENVSYEWTRNGTIVSNQADFEFTPVANDTGVVTFSLIATNCGGEEITDNLTIHVKAKPATQTSGTTNVAWTGFNMFPNPAVTSINFDQSYKVRLFNTTGQLMSLTDGDRVDVSMLPNGLYVAIIQNNDGATTHRIVTKIWFSTFDTKEKKPAAHALAGSLFVLI